MMLAARLYGAGDIRVEEIPVPEIADDEILIKVESAGICGTDLRMIDNGLPGDQAGGPRTLGHEFAGVVSGTGKKVQGYAPGMRVAAAPNLGCGICDQCVRGDAHLCPDYQALGVQLDGGFAEYVRIPGQAVRSGNVAVLPDSVTFGQATLIEPLSCVYSGLLQCPVRLGDDVLIIGAGPIGVLYAMLAKRAGAGRVFVCNRSEDRLTRVKQLDSSFITLAADGLEEAVARLTDGRGVDMCVTANPSPEAQRIAVELTGVNGRINWFGGLPKTTGPVPVDTNRIHYKQISVTGTTKANNFHFRQAMRFIAGGMIQAEPLLSRSFGLPEGKEAFAYAKSSQGWKTWFAFSG